MKLENAAVNVVYASRPLCSFLKSPGEISPPPALSLCNQSRYPQVARLSSPGPELLSRLLAEHGAALVLYARGWHVWPEDVVQEAFLQLMREPVEPPNVVAWLYRVVRNRAISATRSQARRQRHEARAAEVAEPWFTASPDDTLDAAAATEALTLLPAELREAIVLRLWGGLTLEQIAELTKVSISTAHRRYVAGLTALRERSSPWTNKTTKTPQK